MAKIKIVHYHKTGGRTACGKEVMKELAAGNEAVPIWNNVTCQACQNSGVAMGGGNAKDPYRRR